MTHTFAARLAALLEERGLSRSSLAAGLGISRQTVYNWLKTDRITSGNLNDLARFLEVSPGWLRYGVEESEADISARKALDGARADLLETIIRNECRLRAAIHAANLAIWEYDVIHDRVTWQNHASLSQQIQVPPLWDSLDDFLERVHPEDRSGLADAVRRVVRAGEADLRELRLALPGGYRWFTSSLGALRDGSGRQVGLVGVLQDIQQGKEAEEARRRDQARYRFLFEHSPMSLWEEDFSGAKAYLEALRRQGVEDLSALLAVQPDVLGECLDRIRLVDVNQAAAEWRGSAAAARPGQSHRQAWLPEVVLREDLLAIWRGQTRHQCEFLAETMDGGRRPAVLHWEVVPGHEESLSRVLVSLMTTVPMLQPG